MTKPRFVRFLRGNARFIALAVALAAIVVLAGVSYLKSRTEASTTPSPVAQIPDHNLDQWPFPQGTLLVGADAAPGLYISQTVDAGTVDAAGHLPTCSWARTRNSSGEVGPENLIGAWTSFSRTVAYIGPEDIGFRSAGCSGWTPVADTPPVSKFGPGMWLVNTEIIPGRYVADSGTFVCQWNLTSSFYGANTKFGTFGSEVTSDSSAKGRAIVDISAEDFGFVSVGCGDWSLYEAPLIGVSEFGPGMWVVGSDIYPGVYWTDGTRLPCTWTRVSGFNDTSLQIIETGGGTGRAVAEIQDGDVGFVASGGCLGWAPLPKQDIASLADTFSDGAWRVGTDITAGRYVSYGDPAGAACLLQVIEDGPSSEQPTSRLFSGPGHNVADLSDGETVVNTSCGGWSLVDTHPVVMSDILTDGTWIVGVDVAPGAYVSEVSDSCSWSFLSGFSMDPSGVVAGDHTSSGPITVTIKSDDVGFASLGCDGWSRSP